MRRCCYLEIDRENPKNAFATVGRAVDFIKNDVCPVGLFPEGHRTHQIHGRRAIDVCAETKKIISDFLNEKGEAQNDTSTLQPAGK